MRLSVALLCALACSSDEAGPAIPMTLDGTYVATTCRFTGSSTPTSSKPPCTASFTSPRISLLADSARVTFSPTTLQISVAYRDDIDPCRGDPGSQPCPYPPNPQIRAASGPYFLESSGSVTSAALGSAGLGSVAIKLRTAGSAGYLILEFVSPSGSGQGYTMDLERAPRE